MILISRYSKVFNFEYDKWDVSFLSLGYLINTKLYHIENKLIITFKSQIVFESQNGELWSFRTSLWFIRVAVTYCFVRHLAFFDVFLNGQSFWFSSHIFSFSYRCYIRFDENRNCWASTFLFKGFNIRVFLEKQTWNVTKATKTY